MTYRPRSGDPTLANELARGLAEALRAAVVVGPGDTLVLAFEQRLTDLEYKELTDSITLAQLPFKVLVVHGAGLAVHRAGAEVPSQDHAGTDLSRRSAR